MLLNTLSLSFLDMTSKYLKLSMNSSHIVFLYKSLLFLIILPWVFKDGIRNIHSAKLHIHLIRSFFSVAGSLAFIKGLQYVSLADASALENVQYMILVFAGMIFFKESVTKTKIFALVIGILGCIIVVKPTILSSIYAYYVLGAPDFNFEVFETENRRYFGYTLMAMAFWSMNSISVKILGRTEKNKTQMFYLMLFATIWTMPFAFVEWGAYDAFFNLPVKPIGLYTFSEFNFRAEYFILILFMALCYFVHGVAYFNALKYDLSIVVPFRYTKLLFSTVIGYYIFAETQNPLTIVGYALIVLSGLSLTRYEYRKYKYSKTTKT